MYKVSLARRRVCVLTAVFLLFGTYSLLAQSSEAPAAPVQPAGQQSSANADANAYRLRIAGGDLLEIMILGADELKRSVRVGNGGDISLPLIGPVQVGGNTTEQAEKMIGEAYRRGDFVKDPQVTVLIKEFATQGISVLGEVAKPGVYQSLGARRLFDMISTANGMTDKAGQLITITHRDQPEKPIQVNLKGDLSRSIDANVEVYPGDTIVVSKAGIVYVVGDVVKPGGFVMEHNERLTVLQAIALAQGTKNTASLKDAKIIRRGPGGVTETPVDLKQVMYAKAPDQMLQSDDIIFVPVSAAKSVSRRGLEAILQTASGLAIYRPY
jgi:polysaccharide biosynthesis/export protein